MTHYHPEDRPDPSEQPIRARVPDHVATGAFSTGVIVMTAQTEFILDFVQNLGRPHQIVARVVMPHYVLPQLVDAMQRNIELYRNRWGELPQMVLPRTTGHEGSGQAGTHPTPDLTSNGPSSAEKTSGLSSPGTIESPAPPTAASQGMGSNAGSDSRGPSTRGGADEAHEGTRESGAGGPSAGGSTGQGPTGQGSSAARQASVQEIYDDLKIRDEFLSGVYANAVMIGHGPHEFSFDFITNFYPHSAVSARVFLAAGQIPRLFESLKGTWEQLRHRMQPPPDNPLPPPDNNPLA